MLDDFTKGTIAGALVSAGLFSLYYAIIPYRASNIKLFPIESESKPAVMRAYRIGADSIYVRDNSEKDSNARGDNYIPLREYLRTISDLGERAVEEAEIKRTVGWFE